MNQTMEKVMSLLSYKIKATVEQLVAFSVYRSSITLRELNTAQAFLLAFFEGLMTQDADFCTLLLALEPGVSQLPSPYLPVWLREDFNFPKKDVLRVLKALNTMSLNIPFYVSRVFSELEIKYVNGDYPDRPVTPELEELNNETTPMFIRRCLSMNYDASDKDVSYEAKQLKFSGLPLLFLLSRAGHLEGIAELLKLEVPWNQSGKDGLTALHIAAAHGQVSSLETIFAEVPGVDLNVVSFNGNTPLHVAASYGQLDAVKWLLRNGADLNALADTGQSAVHKAAKRNQTEVLQFLLDYHAEKRRLEGLYLGAVPKYERPVDSVDSYVCTPLHVAARFNSVDCCRMLVAYGADLNSRCIQGKTPLIEANLRGAREAAEALIELGADEAEETDFCRYLR